jgi:ATP-dependent DNA helicase RecQ
MKEVLKNYFGYAEFRGHQENIIGSVLKGNDVFVQMTTGSGKSLCYQVPALMLPGVALIV